MKPPRCAATLIGSLPHTDPAGAVRLVLDHLHEAPIWPELPRRSFLEEIIPAHTAGLPCLVVDEPVRRLYVDTAGDCADALAGFYEKAMAAEQSGDLSAFALDERHASALEPTARALEGTGKRFPFVKVHSIGPVSFQLGLADEQDRPLYYDDTFQDVLIRQIALQSRWMVQRFAPYCEEVIAFLDEPSLAAFGSSACLGVLREDVIARLGVAVDALKAEGAVAGVHVCGNTDWPMVLEAGADLLNCDAYGFGESMLVYADQVIRHLQRGGIMAWGVVPTSEKIHTESVRSLRGRFFSLIDGLVDQGADRDLVLAQSMITPSCGMGTMSVEDAGLVVRLLCELARQIQDEVR